VVIVRRELEAAFEQKLVREARMTWGLRSLKLTLRYDAGWPDRVWLIPARPFWTELKRGGEEPSLLQYQRLDYLQAIGYDVAWFDNFEAAWAALQTRMK
jgi:hypothetical protein